MDIRFITKNMHAAIDYPVAALLIGAPFLLGLGESNPTAKWLSVVVGVAALLLTILTNHKTGIIRILPYRFHVAVDGAVGVLFLVAPFVFKFEGLDALYYWLNAMAVITVVSLAAPEKRGEPVAA